MGEQLKMKKIKIEKEKELDKNKKNFRNVEVMLPCLKLTIFVKQLMSKLYLLKLSKTLNKSELTQQNITAISFFVFVFFIDMCLFWRVDCARIHITKLNL